MAGLVALIFAGGLRGSGWERRLAASSASDRNAVLAWRLATRKTSPISSLRRRKVSPFEHTVPPTDERTSMLAGTLADSLLESVERTVQASAEFIQKFKELAHKLNLPSSDEDFQSLNRAQSVLLARLEAARRLASSLVVDPQLARKAAATEEIAAILRQVRRVRLFLQLKIFRVDRILDQDSAAPEPSPARKRREHLH